MSNSQPKARNGEDFDEKANRREVQAYEIALPILEQQERGEGEWIEWGGGECPVDSDTIVGTKWSDGDKILNRAGVFHWHHVYGPNIIAYRIIPERATNQNGEQ
jgi:hypothetical protein